VIEQRFVFRRGYQLADVGADDRLSLGERLLIDLAANADETAENDIAEAMRFGEETFDTWFVGTVPRNVRHVALLSFRFPFHADDVGCCRAHRLIIPAKKLMRHAQG
jgi:hypothetical protein